MNKRSVATLLSMILIFGFAAAPAQAKKQKKKVITEAEMMKELDTLHQSDSDAQQELTIDDARKMVCDNLALQHRSLPPVSQEPQHTSLIQRQTLFLGNYRNKADDILKVIQGHADVEKGIRGGQIQMPDSLIAINKWANEEPALQTALKSIRDSYAQIGQDYMDIFRDHNTSSPDVNKLMYKQ